MTVVSINGNGTLWRKVADDNVNQWTQVAGTAVTVATPNASQLVYSDAARLLYVR
ncbi:hypothetical protein AB5I41_18925 [Sphingomonas sp. MMS24-JH45]